jgi:tetratricopeptide (TPR) repeat protein
MDVYYFSQAAFTWDLHRFAEVNELLERGTKYRTWDGWLFFYLGFNYSYFLKDYQKGAQHFQRAAELTNNPLFGNLAARYFYESKQTDLALVFLNSMIAQTNDKAVRQMYIMRQKALTGVAIIENAISAYHSRYKRNPQSIEELVNNCYLKQVPADPYGGKFYIDEQGRVRTTSKLANSNLQ